MLRTAPSPTLDAAYAWLRTLVPRGIQLGLERVEAALTRLGSPQRGMPAVTIAGTNGKGSTAAFLASMAHTAGYRVGLYTSPHLVSVTERIQVGGTPILPFELSDWAERVRAIVDGSDGESPVPLTFFEALTVMAIGYFAAREVDLAVLEVGLGGRLDATRAVPPLVSVLTPIGLDHQAYLGSTLEAICAEKAGILRRGGTVVSGVAPELFRAVVGPRAFDLRCPIRRSGVDFVHRWLHRGFRYRGWIHRAGPVRLGLRGLHQGDNAALACAAAESLCAHGFHFKPYHMAEGLQRARHPGRLERREPQVDADGRSWPAILLDGAHNPMGARALARHIPLFLSERPRVLLFGAREDKDHATMLDALLPHVDEVVLTATAETPLASPELLAALLHRRITRVTVEPSLPRALTHARACATPTGGLLVTGSLYLLGELIPLLPAPQPQRT